MVHFLQDILKKASQGRLRRRVPADLPSGPGGRSPPLQRPEIFAAVIRWHRPCRVVRRAANQNKMIAGGDHSIT